MTPHRRRLTAAVTVAAMLASAGLSACLAAGPTGRVSVLASWEGAEREAFERVLDRFTEKHGIEYHYQGTRALSQVLLAAVRDGTAPDVAVLPNPGELAGYARQGALYPLDDVPGLDPTDRRRSLRQDVAGVDRLYAVAIKADLKSLVWYNPARFGFEPPRTWDELVGVTDAIRAAGGAPWCLGMGAPPASGWPGTDWIEDILLHRHGVETYQRWARGDLEWTSEQVRDAWDAWGSLVASPGAVYGGAVSALLTDFGNAGRAMFDDPPGCFLEHQASFIMGSYEGYGGTEDGPPRRGIDFLSFPFPGLDAPREQPDRAVVVSADLVGMFNDTPQARKLVQFLASEEAQLVWAGARPGTVFSLSDDVDPDRYGDWVSRGIAEALLEADRLCFDASDLMPGPMANAFFQAVLEFLHDPEALDRLLLGLEDVREGIEDSEWLDLPCGR